VAPHTSQRNLPSKASSQTSKKISHLALKKRASKNSEVAVTAAIPADKTPAKAKSDDLQMAQQMADAGRLSEAAVICESYIREKGPSVLAYYLLGLTHEGRGRRVQAVEYYRKALYLEPGHIEVLTHLALVLQAEGDAAGAQRIAARARRAEERLAS
jgi:chemotaxis protein methyltransferase WspC